MRLPWSAREYDRTCADCGYTWRVPAQFARKTVVPLPGVTIGVRARGRGPVTAADLQAGRELAEDAEAFRACPECASRRYSQRPVRS